MKPFDLVFIGCVFFTAFYLTWILSLAVRRRGAAAVRHLGRLALCLGGYTAIVVVVGLLAPRFTLGTEGILRYDDWCIRVEATSDSQRIGQVSAPAGNKFVIITLRVISEARRGRQSAPNGSLVYLLDANEKRFDVSKTGQEALEKSLGPQPELMTKLDPKTSFLTVRVFEVPANVQELFLAHRHGSGFPGLLIIGEGFRKVPIIRLPIHKIENQRNSP